MAVNGLDLVGLVQPKYDGGHEKFGAAPPRAPRKMILDGAVMLWISRTVLALTDRVEATLNAAPAQAIRVTVLTFISCVSP